MDGKTENKNMMQRVAAFIVDRRRGFYLIYILILLFSIFSMSWVSVDNDITDYLAEDSETRIGLSIMDDEFITYATADIMVDNISYTDALALKSELEKIEGVKEIAFDDTTDHYAAASALFSVTFDGESYDPICESALDELKEKVSGYDCYISAELGNTRAETIAAEINVIMIIAVIIILVVLLFTSRTYMEVPVQMLTFGAAALINMGTNYIFGTISFVSNSIAVVLQLALAIDYAIILCHRYTEERETSEAREAVILALSKAIPEISGSCLTTLSGLAAMSFMTFRLGFDMSMVLIKAIIISIVVVFTLMPGLLMSFAPLIDKTHHKNFVPQIIGWTNIVEKTRYVLPVIFFAVSIVGFFLSHQCPYAYSDTNLTTIAKNDSQIAKEMIRDTFSQSNTLAVILPSGDYASEQALSSDLLKYDEVSAVTGLASVEAKDGYAVGDQLTPREFSELTDLDIEVVEILYAAYAVDHENYGKIVGGIDNFRIPLIDLFDFAYDMSNEGYVELDKDTQDKLDELHDALSDGRDQLESGNHTRLVLDLDLPEESEETFAFLSVIREAAKKYYDQVILCGNSTSNYDLSSTFENDNTIISILSILFVLLVLFFTFQSAGIPFILILVIQGSIYINFSFPTLMDSPLYFISYLVVSSIQMGANIDYAIVITNRYVELRKILSKTEAAKQALNQAFPTVFTSGSILTMAGFVIGLLSSDPAISSIGLCLGRGTLISIALVMSILPQLLILGDFIIDKTSFSLMSIRNGGANVG